MSTNDAVQPVHVAADHLGGLSPGAGGDGERPPKAAASLDNRTQLRSRLLHRLNDVEVVPPFSLAIYPDAGEAVLCLHDTREPATHEPAARDDGPTEGMQPSRWADLDEDERLRRNWERSNRRAFVESRRYFVANRLRYQWVLTFTGAGLHGADGRQDCMRLVADFVVRFKAEFGSMPYWFSPELHPGGHGWHVNFYIPKRLPQPVVQSLWIDRPTAIPAVTTGTTWVSDKTKHPKVVERQLPFIEALRLAAEYGCKYASKDWDPQQIGRGGHRYVAAEGFRPKKLSLRVWSDIEGLDTVTQVFGIEPTWVWRSCEDEEWDGPPVAVMRWSYIRGGEPSG